MSSPHSRRAFLRNLSGAAAMATAAGVTHTTSAAEEFQSMSPDIDLTRIRRWASSGANWKALREHFLLDPEITHLNTGTLGASPRAVVELHAKLLREIEGNPVPLVFGPMEERMEQVRKDAAVFFGVDGNEITITANTTSGMNLVAEALPLEAGDEVLTTNQEHAGGRICWDYEKNRRGIVIREINLPATAPNEAALLKAFEETITSRTRVISVSHVITISGLKMPVAALSAMAKARGIAVVVDGAQAAGMFNIDLHALGCDAYATSAHKWLLGPKGCGFLYLRKDFQQKLSSVYLAGGMGVYTGATGTRNVAQVLALGQTLKFFQAIGIPRIEERARGLAGELRRRLNDVPGIGMVSPSDTALQSALTTIQLPEKCSGSTVSQQLLERYGIVVKAVPGEHLQGRGLRISTHFYNTEAELDQFVGALRELVR